MSPVESGPLHTPYELEAENEYIFRTRVYAVASKKDAPVRMVILAVAGKGVKNGVSDEEAEKLVGAAVKGLRPFVILKTVEVKAQNAKKAEVVEVKLPKMEGVENGIAVEALYKDAGRRRSSRRCSSNIFPLEGPLDTAPILRSVKSRIM